MNFTREPIIETIITPREGFKLVVRSSKGGNQEEYSVDAVEVVSFGHSFFFRSLERPKSFLVPVSDYEVIEAKETRIVLKNLSVEKTIKIGGGREATIKAAKEPAAEKNNEPQVAEAGGKKGSPSGEPRTDKKRERRRHRRRRGGTNPEEGKEAGESPSPVVEGAVSGSDQPKSEGGDAVDEMKISSSTFSRLFPPPPLISETLGRDKKKDEEAPSRDLPSSSVTTEEKKASPDSSSSGSAPIVEEGSWSEREGPNSMHQDMMRVGVDQPAEALTSTSFFRLFFK